MIKPNNVLFAALLVGISTSSHLIEASFFDMDAFEAGFEQHFQHMQQAMQHMHNQLKNNIRQTAWAVPSYGSLSLDAKDNAVTITLSDIEATNLEAVLNDAHNKLNITTSEDKITLWARDNVLGIEVIKYTKNNDEKNKEAVYYRGASINRMERSLNGKPLLEQQTIDYNPTSKELIITIPLQSISKGKVIPINTISSQPVAKTTPTEKTAHQKEPAIK